MTRALLIALFFIGGLICLGYYSYQKVLAVGIASGTVNYYQGASKAVPTSVVIIRSCTKGDIPFLPSYKGKIDIDPPHIRLAPNARVKVINTDSDPHTLGIAFTNFNKTIQAGNSLDLTYKDLPKSGTWGLTCDGINLGDQSPTIIIFEL
jgi:hypothetical protein